MTPVDSVGYATTRSHSTFNADGADIYTPHKITWGHESTLAAIDSPVLRPCAAEETLLRRIRFVDLDAGGQLIVEHGDEFAIAGRGNSLCFFLPHLLCGIVERFANIGFRIGKGIGDFPCGFMAQIPYLVLCVRQHTVFAALQASMPPRTLRFVRLLCRDCCQTLITKLHRCFDLTSTDKDRMLSIGRSNDCIDPKIDAKHWPPHPQVIGDFADDFDAPVVEAHLHQSSREHYLFWQANNKPSGSPTRQTERSIADFRTLVREDHLSIARPFIRILVLFPALAQRLCRRNGFAEIRNRLLHRLRMQGRELPFALLLQLGLGRPLLALLSGISMPFHEPGPQASGFQACSSERLPMFPRFREPVYFYRAITHALSIAHWPKNTMAKAEKALHLLPLKRRSFRGLKPAVFAPRVQTEILGWLRGLAFGAPFLGRNNREPLRKVRLVRLVDVAGFTPWVMATGLLRVFREVGQRLVELALRAGRHSWLPWVRAAWDVCGQCGTLSQERDIRAVALAAPAASIAHRKV